MGAVLAKNVCEMIFSRTFLKKMDFNGELKFSTCGVVDLRSSDVVPLLLLNFTQDNRFCGILSSSGGTTAVDHRSTTPHVFTGLSLKIAILRWYKK